MADPLKRGLEAMFRFHGGVWDDRDAKERIIPEIGHSPRTLAQTLGTEWGRELIHPDLWVILAHAEYRNYGALIIPDIRFENEARWIKREGGTILSIERPGLRKIETSDHVSESGIPEEYIDARVYNGGSIEELIQEGVNALAEVGN
jgi:hypothetical protein